jgi:hypothetical protein
VLHKLSVITAHDVFSAQFAGNLAVIYKCDITFMKHEYNDQNESIVMDKLGLLRLAMYHILCQTLPMYSWKEMYNLGKVNTLAEDTYLMWYSIVNKLVDRRLDRVLRQSDRSETD